MSVNGTTAPVPTCVARILPTTLPIPLASMAMFEIEYASLTQVVLRPHKTRLQLLNFTPWREMAS